MNAETDRHIYPQPEANNRLTVVDIQKEVANQDSNSTDVRTVRRRLHQPATRKKTYASISNRKLTLQFAKHRLG